MKQCYKSLLFLLVVVESLLIALSPAGAQQIQWASSVVFEYNAFGQDSWSGRQVLGPPDALPFGQLHPNAYRITEESGFGKIVLGFDNPIHVKQLIIVENYLPGRIDKISLYDEEDQEHLLHQPKNQVLNIQYRLLTISTDKTPYKVTKVAINLSTYHNPGWSQIDAVGISEEIIPKSEIELFQNEFNYIFDEKLTFVSKKAHLGPNINSIYNEAKPLISPDGRTLYFVRENAPQNIGGIYDQQDIYYSNLINGEWTIAQNIGSPLNDELPNGICTISPDGNTLWVMNFYHENGLVEDGLSVTHRTDNGWSKPEPLRIENFYNKNDYQDYFMSNDGTVLLMAIERDDTYGDQDLYVSFHQGDNRWSRPRNLGGTINTDKVEYAPFLSPDNLTLFYSSNGRYYDNEDSDIYYTKRLDREWKEWSKPENIGVEVNTPAWDAYFALAANAKHAYFVSNHKETVKLDKQKNPDKDIYQIGLGIEPKNDEIFVLRGRTIEKNTGNPVKANIMCTVRGSGHQEENKYEVSSPVSGEFNIMLNNRFNYRVEVESEGFLPFNLPLTINDSTSKERYFAITIEMVPIKPGESFEINDLFFVQSRSEILPESLPTLNKLVDMLNKHPELSIELGGHTDNLGSKRANLELSLQRAESVKQYLLEQGISRKRIKAIGYGSKFPVIRGSDPDRAKINRRVEVKILDA